MNSYAVLVIPSIVFKCLFCSVTFTLTLLQNIVERIYLLKTLDKLDKTLEKLRLKI